MLISKNKVLAITMTEGVKVYIIDLKRKYKYELKEFRDT